MQDNTKSLAVRAQSGDETAFTEIYNTHYAYLYRTAYGILHSHEDAEDAVNGAFFKIWNELSKWNPSKGEFIVWMSVLARNSFIDAYRMRQRYLKNYRGISLEDKPSSESDCVLLEAVPDSCLSIEDAIIAEEQMRRLENALLQVRKPEWRLAWMLYHFEGYSHKEIGTILDVRWQTCKQWCYRCNVQIKRLLEVSSETDELAD